MGLRPAPARRARVIRSRSHRRRSWSAAARPRPVGPTRAAGGTTAAPSARAARGPRGRRARGGHELGPRRRASPQRSGRDQSGRRGRVALVEDEVDRPRAPTSRAARRSPAGTSNGSPQSAIVRFAREMRCATSAPAAGMPGRSRPSSARRGGAGSARSGTHAAPGDRRRTSAVADRRRCRRRRTPRSRSRIGMGGSPSWAYFAVKRAVPSESIDRPALGRPPSATHPGCGAAVRATARARRRARPGRAPRPGRHRRRCGEAGDERGNSIRKTVSLRPSAARESSRRSSPPIQPPRRRNGTSHSGPKTGRMRTSPSPRTLTNRFDPRSPRGGHGTRSTPSRR